MPLTEDLFQLDPKGSYYLGAKPMIAEHETALGKALEEDREVFTLALTLPGTAYAKGRMIRQLLKNAPVKTAPKKPVEIRAMMDDLFLEQDAIRCALLSMGVTRAIKVLCSLVTERINNARTRRAMTGWLFDREPDSLAEIALRYRRKTAKILRHCYSLKDLAYMSVGSLPTGWPFKQQRADAIAFAIHAKEVEGEPYRTYYRLRDLAAGGKAEEFMEVLNERKAFPYEIALGFRNTYKLPVPLGALMESTRMSQKQALQSQAAATREGAEVVVDYGKQSLYDLWKIYFHKAMNCDAKDLDKIKAAIDQQSKVKIDIDLGDTLVVFDASRSMEGSPERPFHPLLVGATITSRLPGIREVHFVGGLKMKGPGNTWAMTPYGSTDIAGPLASVLWCRRDSVLVISDGYENTISGMADYVLKIARKAGITSKVIHVSPVVGPNGKPRRIFSDVEPLLVTDVEYLKTAHVCRLLRTDRAEAMRLLMGEYRKLFGRQRSEVEFLLS